MKNATSRPLVSNVLSTPVGMRRFPSGPVQRPALPAAPCTSACVLATRVGDSADDSRTVRFGGNQILRRLLHAARRRRIISPAATPMGCRGRATVVSAVVTNEPMAMSSLPATIAAQDPPACHGAELPGTSLSIRDAGAMETPARRATSAIVMSEPPMSRLDA